MPKNRSSLHSLLAPSFFSPPASPAPSDSSAIHVTNDQIPSTRSSSSVEQTFRSHTTNQQARSQSYSTVTSPRSSPPPAFLIDDDPFANLSSPPYASSSHHVEPLLPSLSSSPNSSRDKMPSTPRSPLSPSSTETKLLSFTCPSPNTALPPGISRTLSGRARPAYQKPAFAPRPSLPSLHTLAKMDVVFTPKVCIPLRSNLLISCCHYIDALGSQRPSGCKTPLRALG
jgi:hypothetical protein